MKSILVYLVPPTHKLAKTGSKSPKIPSKTSISGKTEVISKKRKWSWDRKLNSDPEKAPFNFFYFFKKILILTLLEYENIPGTL